jgi:hypothetical protein
VLILVKKYYIIMKKDLLVEVLNSFNPTMVECILDTYHFSLQCQSLLLLFEEYLESLMDSRQYDLAVETISKVFDFSFVAAFLKNDYHFQDDTDTRDIYTITLKRGSRSYSFKYGQSIVNSSHYLDNKSKLEFTLNGKGIGNTYSIGKAYLERNVGKGSFYLYSLIAGKKPSLYNVLTCLQKYEVGTFEDFCSEFGYDTDSRRAKKTYKAVSKEYQSMCGLFSNEELACISIIQ